MKKIIGVFILLTSLAYGEGFLFFGNNSEEREKLETQKQEICLLYTSPSPRDCS